MIGTIAFNVELRRPGCAIVQGVMGAQLPEFAFLFPSHTWLLNPTGCRVFRINTKEELDQLIQMSLDAVKPHA